MKFISYNSAIKKMDRYSSKDKAFLFILDFAKNKGFCNPLNKIDVQELRYKCSDEESNVTLKKDFHFSSKPISYGRYKKAFDKVKHQIEIGNSYLLNLTFQTKIETDLSLDEIFQLSQV